MHRRLRTKATLFADYFRYRWRIRELLEWIRLQRDAGRDKEVHKEIERVCLQEVGLPFSVLWHSSPEQISELLREGVNYAQRALFLAELLIQKSELNAAAGEIASMIRGQLQAYCLIGEFIDMLPADDQVIYRPKLAQLAYQLRQTGNSPYLTDKLNLYEPRVEAVLTKPTPV